MKQEQKTHVSADALIQLLKGAKSIRRQLALGVVMNLVLVVCALVIPTQMGALVQILIDYFDAPETGASVLAQLAPGLLALLGVYLLRAAVSYGKMQLLNRAVSRYFTCNLRIQISDKIQRLPVSFVDHTPVGDILSRMTEDVSRIGGSLHTVLDTITGGFPADPGHRGRDVFAELAAFAGRDRVHAGLHLAVGEDRRPVGNVFPPDVQAVRRAVFRRGGGLYELRDDKGLQSRRALR